jgi:hypothetical protein
VWGGSFKLVSQLEGGKQGIKYTSAGGTSAQDLLGEIAKHLIQASQWTGFIMGCSFELQSLKNLRKRTKNLRNTARRFTRVI